MTASLSSIATPLANARAAFSSPDLMSDEVLDTAALVLARSPYPDDQTIAREWQRRRAEQERDHAEWSDLGRSPRFPSGWWIVPLLICGLAFWASIIWLAFTPDANADGRQFSNDVKEFESD